VGGLDILKIYKNFTNFWCFLFQFGGAKPTKAPHGDGTGQRDNDQKTVVECHGS